MDRQLQKIYQHHRKALQRELPDGLILIAGGTRQTRNHDVTHSFRQRSDFLWATGVEDAGYALLMAPSHGTSTLFIPRIDQTHRVWMGHVPGIPETRKLYGTEAVAYLDELPEHLKKLAAKGGKLYTDAEGAGLVSKVRHGLKRDTRRYREALDGLRVIKDAGELSLMQHASNVTGAGHRAAMAVAGPGMYEFQIQAVVEAEFRARGLKHTAYESIVATGAHSAVLHYVKNDSELRKGDLLLVDAGAECLGYAADITRTFPVSGRFTRRQKDVYEVVLSAHDRCIDAVLPGSTTAAVHRLSMEILTEGMRSLGFLKGTTAELLETEAIRVFYPHGLGHPLGLDVHDTDGGKRLAVKGKRPKNLRAVARLEPGFVMTVEPGIYFIEALIKDPELRRKHKGRVDFARAEKYLDFGGVRIEDNVVVQAKGPPRNLTDVPKTVADVEAACRD